MLSEAIELEPEAIFKRLCQRPGCFWLDSALYDSQLGCYSMLGSDPFATLQSNGHTTRLKKGNQTQKFTENPLQILEKLLANHRQKTAAPLPFCGAAIGAIAYDFKPQNPKPSEETPLPQLAFGFYNAAVCIDHLKKKTYITAKTARELQQLRERLEQTPQQPPPIKTEMPRFTSNFTRENYLEAVKKAKAYIVSGDIYQINIAQQFQTPLRCEASELYCELRTCNPAPYGGYLDFGDFQILSSSPELFVQVDPNGNILTRPIKGTQARLKDAIADKNQQKKLLNSPKEQAELLMITDLLRNDLGRVCQTGSVEVNSLYQLESYAAVHHLISEIQGKLKPNTSLQGLLQATFPGGSITGAPKIRAMELIDELEADPRGFFFGSMGYFGFDDSIKLNIAIRTLLCTQEKIHLGVGAGITCNSEPEREYEETLQKASAIFQAIQKAHGHAPHPRR